MLVENQHSRLDRVQTDTPLECFDTLVAQRLMTSLNFLHDSLSQLLLRRRQRKEEKKRKTRPTALLEFFDRRRPMTDIKKYRMKSKQNRTSESLSAFVSDDIRYLSSHMRMNLPLATVSDSHITEVDKFCCEIPSKNFVKTLNISPLLSLLM